MLCCFHHRFGKTTVPDKRVLKWTKYAYWFVINSFITMLFYTVLLECYVTLCTKTPPVILICIILNNPQHNMGLWSETRWPAATAWLSVYGSVERLLYCHRRQTSLVCDYYSRVTIGCGQTVLPVCHCQQLTGNILSFSIVSARDVINFDWQLMSR